MTPVSWVPAQFKSKPMLVTHVHNWEDTAAIMATAGNLLILDVDSSEKNLRSQKSMTRRTMYEAFRGRK